MNRFNNENVRQLSYDFSQRVAMLMQDEINTMHKSKNKIDHNERAMKLVSQGLRRCLILAEDYLSKDMTDQEKNNYIDNLTASINKEIKKGIIDTEFNMKG